MAFTVTYGDRHKTHDQFAINFNATYDSSYLTGGEVLTAELFGLDRFENIELEDSEGYTFDADIASGGATAQIKAYRVAVTYTGTALAADTVTMTDDDTAATNGTILYVAVKDGKMEEGVFASENANNATASFTSAAGLTTFVVDKPVNSATITITDDDTAATNGAALYVRPIGDGQKAVLQFVSPTNASASFTLSNGGDTVYVKDSDEAAEDGASLVFFDEDATAGYRLRTVSTMNTSLFVQTSTGRWVQIYDDDTAASNGVQLYLDEDGTNSYQRMLFVSPTNAAGSDSNNSLAAWNTVTDDNLVAVYFDQDGTAGQRFLQYNAALVDIPVPFVDLTNPTADVRLLTVAYHATASATGVAVYYDDDNATATAKLRFVSATNTSGSDILNSNLTFYGSVSAGAIADTALTEVDSGTSMSTIAIDGVAYGR